MKKGKVLGKSQIILAVMIVALGAAVWLNVRYSSSGSAGNTKYLGQADFVDNVSGEAVETSAKAQSDYFSATRESRTKTRNSAKEELTETIKNAGENSSAAAAAVKKAAEIAARETAESNIESLLNAKGLKEVLAVIGDNDVNIVVRIEKLTAEQTLQIQDAAASQSGYPLEKIKILTVQ